MHVQLACAEWPNKQRAIAEQAQQDLPQVLPVDALCGVVLPYLVESKYLPDRN